MKSADDLTYLGRRGPFIYHLYVLVYPGAILPIRQHCSPRLQKIPHLSTWSSGWRPPTDFPEGGKIWTVLCLKSAAMVLSYREVETVALPVFMQCAVKIFVAAFEYWKVRVILASNVFYYKKNQMDIYCQLS